MKAISNSLMLFRLVSMVVACWALPALLYYGVGPAAGALGAAGAAALWFWQYRVPTRRGRGGSSFWFVAGGYAVIGLTLLAGLGRLLR